MPKDAESARAVPGEHEAIGELLRKAGVRATHQRIEVLRVLASATDHPAAEEIHRRLKATMPTVSLDTVYRTLASLEEAGLVSRLQWDACARFDANIDAHHHFRCEACHSIQDFYWPDFDEMKTPAGVRKLGRAKTKRVTVQGICRNCPKSATRKPG